MLKRLFSPQQQPYYNQPYPQPNNYYDFNRFQTEINELKRVNSELLKRVVRIENYLGIRGENNNVY